MSPMSATNRARGRLLAGAGLALVMLVAAPSAVAQSAPIGATGDMVVVNSQSSNVLTLAQGDNTRAEIVVPGATNTATITLGGNALGVTARGNNAALLVAPDSLLTLAPRDTMLRAGSSGGSIGGSIGVEGSANLLIANVQDLRGGSAIADQFNAPYRIALGSVATSSVELTGNRSDSTARGNAVVSTIDMPWSNGGGGAGIVSSQSAGGGAQPDGEYFGVAARVRSGSILETGAISGSRIALSGNEGSADAASNAADNSLTASLSTAGSAEPGDGPVMLATPLASDETVAAHYSILNRQQATNVVKARSGYLLDFVLDGGPAIRSTVAGDVDASAIASDGNSLDASARGNLAANRLTLSGSGADFGGTSIGAIANTQSLIGARIVGTTRGGVGVEVAGMLDGSAVSANGNAFSVEAAGNAATENRLTVTGNFGNATGVTSARAVSGGTGGTGGTFTLDNWQDYGATSVTAIPSGPATRIAIAGDIGASALDSSNNEQTARATGDSASNAIDIAAGSFGGSAALASRQSGTGRITTTIGGPGDPGGSMMLAGGSIRDSVLTVNGNSLLGVATGNVAVNSLGLSAATASGSGAPASVGPQGADYGASGSLALLNDQTIGDPALAAGMPAIASSIAARFGVEAAGPVTGSSIALRDNNLRAVATGNAASNAMTSRTAGAGSTLALSSTQFGLAAVAASSDTTLTAPVRLDRSTVSITGNANVATAAINDVQNTVTLNAVRADASVPAASSAHALALATATGNAVLGNQQFAQGSASAVAAKRIGFADSPAVAGGPGIANARLDVDGNMVGADSVGNRALNAMTVDMAAGPGSVALANSQASIATIDASATMLGVGLSSPSLNGVPATVTDDVASAVASGNMAENAISVSGLTGGGEASLSAGRRWADASGNVVLTSAQSNYGQVRASAGDLVALNAGAVTGSSLGIAGNAMSASAYGNVASNTITVGPMAAGGVGLTNSQANYDPVTASVVGAGYQAFAGSLTAGTIGITGNRLSATATGNQASSAIAPPR